MAKSMRSKREKRLRAIRREIVEKESFQQKKDTAKQDALQAALAAPKLPMKPSPGPSSMSLDPMNNATNSVKNEMDVEMGEDDQSNDSLKPLGGIGKKKSKKFKGGKKKSRGKGILRRKHV